MCFSKYYGTVILKSTKFLIGNNFQANHPFKNIKHLYVKGKRQYTSEFKIFRHSSVLLGGLSEGSLCSGE